MRVMLSVVSLFAFVLRERLLFLLYNLYYILYFGTLYLDGIFLATSEMFPRVNLSFKPGSHRRIARAFGACDVYCNLSPRKGFVKIAGTRFPLSRGMHTSPTMQLRREGNERKKKRRGAREIKWNAKRR